MGSAVGDRSGVRTGAAGLVFSVGFVLALCLLQSAPANAAAPGNGRLSGNAGYGDGSSDAGVQIEIRETPGGVHEAKAYTDEAGDWDAGELPAGTYSVNYEVIHFSGGNEFIESAGSEQVELVSGQNKVLHATLSGARPPGVISIDVQGHGPLSLKAAWTVMPGGETQYAGFPGPDGRYRLFVPTGSYEVTGSGYGDDGAATVPVSIANGQEAALTIVVPALPVPAGTVAHDEQQDLTWLNGQRERWGLPAGLISVPTWSQACAAHDAYGIRNGILEHPENPSLPAPRPEATGQASPRFSLLARPGAASSTPGWTPRCT